MLLRVLRHPSDWATTVPKRGTDFDQFVAGEFPHTNLAISVYNLPGCDHQTSSGKTLLTQTVTEHQAGACGGNHRRSVFVDVAWTGNSGLWTMAKAPAHSDQPFFAHLRAAHHSLQFKARADLEDFAFQLLGKYHAANVNNSRFTPPWHTVSGSDMKKYGQGKSRAGDAEWKALCSSNPSLSRYWS